MIDNQQHHLGNTLSRLRRLEEAEARLRRRGTNLLALANEPSDDLNTKVVLLETAAACLRKSVELMRTIKWECRRIR